MSILINSTTNFLRGDDVGNMNTNMTFAGWVRFNSFPGTDVYACIFARDNQPQGKFSVLEYFNGVIRNNNGSSYTLLTSPSLDTWYFFALWDSANNQWQGGKSYYRTESQTSLTTADCWGNNLGDYAANIEFGGNDWQENCDAVFAGLKIWVGATLTDAEILRESYALRAIRRDNLWYENPAFTGSTAKGEDWSGNARLLNSLSGTPTDSGLMPSVSYGLTESGLLVPQGGLTMQYVRPIADIRTGSWQAN